MIFELLGLDFKSSWAGFKVFVPDGRQKPAKDFTEPI
jgi:hypothetical protein